MKVLIISDYDSGYCFSVCKYNTETLAMTNLNYDGRDSNYVIDILNAVANNKIDYLKYYIKEYQTAYKLVCGYICEYDDIIVASDGGAYNVADCELFKKIKIKEQYSDEEGYNRDLAIACKNNVLPDCDTINEVKENFKLAAKYKKELEGEEE